MRAKILNIGDEILSGKTINTNSGFIATELSKLSIVVEEIVVVGDDEEAIRREVLKFKHGDMDILITTGGLGPTHDDLSKETICSALGLDLVIHAETKEKIDKYFNGKAPLSNLKQAYFPKEAIVIENNLGTAPGAIINKFDKHYFILVGPPTELKPMFMGPCLDYLRNLQDEKFLISEYIVMGGGESFFEDLLKDEIFDKLENVSLNPYAGVGKIRYILKSKVEDEIEFKNIKEQFENIMKDYIVSYEDKEVEEVLYDLLRAKNYKISFGESITGGMLASTFINVSGASKCLSESFITYSDESKIKYLNVSQVTLANYGAVSEEVAREMAEGLQNNTSSDVVLAITGYAGPSGEEDKIGLVYYGIKIKDNLYTYKSKFKGDRSMVRLRATLFGYYKLISLLKEE